MNNAERHHIIDEAEVIALFQERIPVKIVDGGIFMCSAGKAKLIIDMKQYDIGELDLIVCFPYTVIQVIDISADFNGKVISATPDFFNTIEVRNRAEFYVNIRSNPCISLETEEWDKLVYMYNRISERKKEKNHPFAPEIDECLLRIMAYEIAAIYMARKPMTQPVVTRRDIIFQEFITELFGSDGPKEREVEAYATKLLITPRHLSMVVKEVSGLTAGEWISRRTITDIKTRLYDNKVSIAQISEEFGFPNPSFFSQYFKKHAGQTPREFRKSIKPVW